MCCSGMTRWFRLIRSGLHHFLLKWEGMKKGGTDDIHDITPHLLPSLLPPLAVHMAKPFFIDSGMLDKAG